MKMNLKVGDIFILRPKNERDYYPTIPSGERCKVIMAPPDKYMGPYTGLRFTCINACYTKAGDLDQTLISWDDAFPPTKLDEVLK